MSDTLLKNTFNKISPAYELVADVTVGVATTQVDFSGLNFGKDDDLLLVVDDYKSSNSGARLYVNDNNVETNYYEQRLSADGTTVSGVRYNSPLLLPLNTNDRNQGFIKIKLTNSGYFVFQTEGIKGVGLSLISLNSLFGSSVFTITSITKITIKSDLANGIDVGSRFQLYRLKAKKVADIIVGSATTQVDITGLNIDKDSEYMLVSDVVNTSGSTAVIAVFPNDNLTNTNYYNQNMNAIDAGVGAVRTNLNNVLGAYTSFKDFSITKIKLTNNGYFVYQSDITQRYGGSSLFLNKNYGTSTFTLTSITKLSIVSSVSNAIGIGSRFTLYKMR